jgi:hypothetical protein
VWGGRSVRKRLYYHLLVALRDGLGLLYEVHYICDGRGIETASEARCIVHQLVLDFIIPDAIYHFCAIQPRIVGKKAMLCGLQMQLAPMHCGVVLHEVRYAGVDDEKQWRGAMHT